MQGDGETFSRRRRSAATTNNFEHGRLSAARKRKPRVGSHRVHSFMLHLQQGWDPLEGSTLRLHRNFAIITMPDGSPDV
jgi:hypothetical protein